MSYFAEMKTEDQILKIKSTLLYILEQCGGCLDYAKLFNLMYFAQQKHLVTSGKPIIEDSFRAQKHGPVPAFMSKVLHSRENKSNTDFGDSFKSIKITRDDKNIAYVSSEEKPDYDELSISDCRCLDENIKEYAHLDSYELSKLSHDSAWENALKHAEEDPEKNRLTLMDIAKAGKAKKETLIYIREQLNFKRALNCN